MSDMIDAVDRREPSDSMILDHSTLDKRYYYRFVQERPTQIARARLKGGRLVRPSTDGVKTLLEQEDGAPEDIIKHGDRVLMLFPKAKHQRNREKIRDVALQRLQTNDQKVRELAKRHKVKLHEDDEGEED